MQAERDSIQIEEEHAVGEYAELQQQAADTRSLIRSMVMQPRYVLPFLQPGRLARVLTSTTSSAAEPNGEDAAKEVL
jgi:ATP-dependent RNA helicase DOB1